jgi:hypothetical protein
MRCNLSKSLSLSFSISLSLFLFTPHPHSTQGSGSQQRIPIIPPALSFSPPPALIGFFSLFLRRKREGGRLGCVCVFHNCVALLLLEREGEMKR